MVGFYSADSDPKFVFCYGTTFSFRLFKGKVYVWESLLKLMDLKSYLGSSAALDSIKQFDKRFTLE